jgi:ribosome-associated heat shock protein Hsp15
MVRTRSAAAALAVAGHVRINGQRITAAGHALRIGDVLTLALDRSVRMVKVAGFSKRRGSAPAARLLYADISPSSGI